MTARLPRAILWCTHTSRNRDLDRNREQVDCMKLCGSFHIAPEPGQGPIHIVPY